MLNKFSYNQYELTDSVKFCAELDKPLIYIPNYGNLGDSLIATGTKMAFDSLGVNFQPLESINKLSNAVLVYAGGGNLVPYYKNCSNFLSAVINKPNSVVILPHTISGHSELIKNLDERHHLFCREEQSYQYVSSFQSAKTYYDHDLALRINPEILFSNYSRDIKNAPEELIKEVEIILRKSIHYSRSNGRIGYFFRGDKESKINKLDNSFDISNLLISNWKLNEFTTLISSAFLMAISMFDKIYTDRLHVAIGASILKIPTTLYPNSYYKNRAVFESSLKKLNSSIIFEKNSNIIPISILKDN